MSDPQQTDNRTPPRRAQLRVRVEQLRHSRKRSLLGVPELAGLAASALMLLAVVFAYLLYLRPAYARLDTAQQKREETYNQLQRIRETFKLNENKQVTIDEITESVEKFEANRLSSRSEGRVTLLGTLNNLVRSNGLRNTAVNYTMLDPLGAAATNSNTTRTGNARLQSLYPGLGINLTVEGAYPNLRHFVRAIEASNQFIVINSVELEKATDSSVAAAAAATEGTGATKPVTRGALVSLRLDMAAYFRREAATETVPTAETR
jgi:Tfp pilus assembly protein PilO